MEPPDARCRMDELTRTLSAAHGYMSLGLLGEAWEELDSLPPRLRVDMAVMLTRMEILSRLEKWEPARMLAESMARHHPDDPGWWVSWAFALRREKSVEVARDVLREAIQVHPGEALMHYNLACYASVIGEMPEAKGLLARAFELDADLKAVALDDPVGAVLLLQPAEADEAGDRLVDPLTGGADHARQLFLGDRQLELVGAVGQLEQALGGATGDVEEH